MVDLLEIAMPDVKREIEDTKLIMHKIEEAAALYHVAFSPDVAKVLIEGLWQPYRIEKEKSGRSVKVYH